MPRKRLSMRKIKEVLRLKWQCGLSNRAIAASCNIGVGTVHEYVSRAVAARLVWPLPEEMTEQGLEDLLFPPPLLFPADQRPLPDWPLVNRDLRRKGVTLRLLWEEYRAQNGAGYGYSRFHELYRAWEAQAAPRMPQVHVAGERIFVDYAGHTMPVADRKTGEVRTAQIFVATLGASSYLYAEATWTQTLPDWIGSHVRAFAFLGGVPQIVVPDNLKSGVKSACYYEPDINPTYLEMARHYGVAILPARVRKPRDKAKVENGVLQVERRILAPLRNQTFFGLAELNAAVSELRDELNLREGQGLPASRKELFETIDRPALSPLPSQPYEIAIWKKARVHIDYHVSIGEHCYSVPFALLKQEVDVRLTERTVEIFHKGERVGSHVRSARKWAYTTLAEHMPQEHESLRAWSPQRLLSWAEKAGTAAKCVVEQILAARQHPEQGYRACLGILRLGEQHGPARLEAACIRAVELGAFSYKGIRSLLAGEPNPPNEPAPLNHPNIRGAGYYQAASSPE